jgi:aconitase B
MEPSTVFRSVIGGAPTESASGYTLAQKIVGRACGLPEGKVRTAAVVLLGFPCSLRYFGSALFLRTGAHRLTTGDICL